MKKILSYIMLFVLGGMLALSSGCGKSSDNSSDNGANADSAYENHELTDKEQAALEFILANVDGVIPKYKEYKYAGNPVVDDYECVRFEFYSDEIFIGAFAKALDDEVMFWDTGFDGNYMYMAYDNGWYVTGNYVNAPVVENNYQNVEAPKKLDDGLSGQYSLDNASFFITLYDADYVGSADGFFRSGGLVTNEAGTDVTYSCAGEIYLSDEKGTLAAESDDNESAEVVEYDRVYVFNGSAGEKLTFMFGDGCVYILDEGTHNGENYNLTGNYTLDYYY